LASRSLVSKTFVEIRNLRSIVDAGLNIRRKCNTKVFRKLCSVEILFVRLSGMEDGRLCLATLHQLNPLVVAAAAAAADGEATGAAGAGESKESSVQVLVLCHTRELAFQMLHEYERFSSICLPSRRPSLRRCQYQDQQGYFANDSPYIVERWTHFWP
jgi:hypothetical protein